MVNDDNASTVIILGDNDANNAISLISSFRILIYSVWKTKAENSMVWFSTNFVVLWQIPIYLLATTFYETTRTFRFTDGTIFCML